MTSTLSVDRCVITVPAAVARRLASRCDTTMAGHQWSEDNVAAARDVLAGPDGNPMVTRLATRLARHIPNSPGWAVLALPPELNDSVLQRAAAGLLAAIGRPFFSIPRAAWLWIGQESSAGRDAASFGGFGAQRLHIDAPNVTRPPDYTSLLVLRPGPAGGGASTLGDLRLAAATLTRAERADLARPAFFEGRVDGLRGVGEPLLPFPVLDPGSVADGWVRWAGKLLGDPRNPADLLAAARRFADALDAHTATVPLTRGHVLVVDQRRIAHGRTALGDQTGIAEGFRRFVLQAKSALDQAAPAQIAGGWGEGNA